MSSFNVERACKSQSLVGSRQCPGRGYVVVSSTANATNSAQADMQDEWTNDDQTSAWNFFKDATQGTFQRSTALPAHASEPLEGSKGISREGSKRHAAARALR
jgi:hypothetical protein